MPFITKYLLFAGTLLIFTGILFWLFPNIFSKLGKLPGDIRIENSNGGGFYFPIVTCILISIVLSLIFYLVKKFLG